MYPLFVILGIFSIVPMLREAAEQNLLENEHIAEIRYDNYQQDIQRVFDNLNLEKANKKMFRKKTQTFLLPQT